MNVATQPVDLVRDLELALDGPLDLVTASALLDLVSPEWLDRLIIEAAARRLPVYAALTYDGRVVIEPAGPSTPSSWPASTCINAPTRASARRSVRAAAARAVERFEHFGYAVVQGRSDWVFGPDDRTIQDALFAGWAELGALTTAMPPDRIAPWLARRRADLAAGRSSLRIGHVDIFARPIGTR